jgi:hypothetical protein
MELLPIFLAVSYGIYKHQLTRSMDRTKHTSCVAPAITRSHFCRFILVGAIRRTSFNPSDAGWDVKRHWRGWEDNTQVLDVLQMTTDSWRSMAQLCVGSNDGPFQNLFCKPLVTGHIPLYLQQKKSLSKTESFFYAFSPPPPPRASFCHISLAKRLQQYISINVSDWPLAFKVCNEASP